MGGDSGTVYSLYKIVKQILYHIYTEKCKGGWGYDKIRIYINGSSEMSTKVVDKGTKIVAISGTARFKIGHACPKCRCDDWVKASPAMQKGVATGKVVYKCRVCDATRKAKYRKANADVVKAYNAEYRKANAAAIKVYKADWKKENSGKANATAAKRRATKLNSTPRWLTKKDLAKIKKIYEDCPSGYQVDHILPLQGKRICGLHVPSNLKAIPASENASKCNREPDWTKKWQPGLHP